MTGWTSLGRDSIPWLEGTITGPYYCGIPTQELLRQNLLGTKWRVTDRFTISFNPDGDWTREIREFRNGSEWIPKELWENTYIQPGSPEIWTYSRYYDGVLEVDSKKTFTYEKTDCMSDLLPYPPDRLYASNPTSVDWYDRNPDSTWTLRKREVFELSSECQPIIEYSYWGNFDEPYKITFEYTSHPEWGEKILDISDNTDKRITRVLTQAPGAPGTWRNSSRTIMSYEGVQINLDTKNELSVPNKYLLAQNYPNPFNPNTTIVYSLPNESAVTITIYDILGNEINQLISQKQPSGTHSIQWNGTDHDGSKVSAGIYFYQLQAGDLVQTKKMVLLK